MEYGGVVFGCVNQLLLIQVLNVSMCQPTIAISSV